MDLLATVAEGLGIGLSPDQLATYRRYFEMLEEGGKTASLVGVRGWDRVRDDMFIRSLSMLTPAPGGYVSTGDWFDDRRVIDVGAGAGIPGLVLKIALPRMQLTLLDSSRKRTGFLREAVQELQMDSTVIIEARAEDAAHDPELRETFDLVLARGVAKLPELAELTLPFARVGGTVIAAKGADVEDEVAAAAYAAEILGAMPAATQSVATQEQAPPDTMIYWLKIGATPDRYPRRSGVPHRRPLLSSSARTPGAHR